MMALLRYTGYAGNVRFDGRQLVPHRLVLFPEPSIDVLRIIDILSRCDSTQKVASLGYAQPLAPAHDGSHIFVALMPNRTPFLTTTAFVGFLILARVGTVSARALMESRSLWAINAKAMDFPLEYMRCLPSSSYVKPPKIFLQRRKTHYDRRDVMYPQHPTRSHLRIA